MESIKETFFGDPTAVYFVVSLCFLGLIGLWWNSRQPKYLKLAGVAVIIGLGTFLIDKFVETDREMINVTINKVVKAVNKRNYKSISGWIAPKYQGYPGSRKKLDRLLETQQKSPRIITLELKKYDLDITDSTAKMTAIFYVKLRSSRFPVKCTIRWYKSNNRWWICGVSDPAIVRSF